MRAAGLRGIGAHRPANRVDNTEISVRLDSSDEWIRERSGIATRGIAGPDETVVEMAVSAGGKALAAAGVDPADIGLVMVATCTLTHAIPGASGRVGARLGLRNAGALDLGAACAGFSYGLSLAADTVRCGTADNVLVIGSEKFSDIIDPYDRSTAFLFGDGAGAAVVGVSDVDGIAPPVWCHDGDQADILRTVGNPPILRMEGQAVYRWATTTLPGLARAACERAGVEIGDLAAVVPHQANLRITDSLVRALKLPGHIVVARDVIDSGNTSAASIPLALSRLLEAGEVRRGDQVLLLGFGAGLTAAGQVVRCP
jgi:3-oxoacyl-[acyl-carrier-protein] synthase-3